MNRFLNKVFCSDALKLLGAMTTVSVDAAISDPMYGANTVYDWGVDPARGDPATHWIYHEPIYQECRRVLKPGGVLAWAQSLRFSDYYQDWFGGHRKWTLLRRNGQRVGGHVWIVQTREQQPIDCATDCIVDCVPMGSLKRLGHNCIKPVEELLFMVENLTKPGQVVLDCFCGLGSTLLAAEEVSRLWIGCDLSRRYCQIAMKRMDDLRRLGPERFRLPLPWPAQRKRAKVAVVQS